MIPPFLICAQTLAIPRPSLAAPSGGRYPVSRSHARRGARDPGLRPRSPTPTASPACSSSTTSRRSSRTRTSRGLWPLAAAMAAPEGTTASGRPMVSLSLALNYALAPESVHDVLAVQGQGAAPGDPERLLASLWGYHALNLAIHLATALALFGVLRRTFTSEPLRGALGTAAIRPRAGDDARLGRASAPDRCRHLRDSARRVADGALPRHDAVLRDSRLERLPHLDRAGRRRLRARHGDQGDDGRRRRSSSCCGTGASAAPLPVRARLPVYTTLAASWVVLAVLVAGGHRTDAAGFGFAAWPWWRYLITQSAVIAHYLRLALVPFPLVLDYGWPAARAIEVWPQLALVAGLAAATMWGIARRSPLGLCRRRVLPDPGADLERAADCHRGGGRASDVPAARRRAGGRRCWRYAAVSIAGCRRWAARPRSCSRLPPSSPGRR